MLAGRSGRPVGVARASWSMIRQGCEVQRLKFPTDQVSCPTFGGPDTRRPLRHHGRRPGAAQHGPLAGVLFRLRGLGPGGGAVPQPRRALRCFSTSGSPRAISPELTSTSTRCARSFHRRCPAARGRDAVRPLLVRPTIRIAPIRVGRGRELELELRHLHGALADAARGARRPAACPLHANRAASIVIGSAKPSLRSTETGTSSVLPGCDTKALSPNAKLEFGSSRTRSRR